MTVLSNSYGKKGLPLNLMHMGDGFRKLFRNSITIALPQLKIDHPRRASIRKKSIQAHEPDLDIS